MTYQGRPAVANKKVSQVEFNQLYLNSLNHPVYRPTVDGHRHFRIAQLLTDFGFALDLTGLNLRNMNFRYADFTGVCLDQADLGGSVCNFADFSGVSCLSLKVDERTKFFGAKLSSAQLLQLQAECEVVDASQDKRKALDLS